MFPVKKLEPSECFLLVFFLISGTVLSYDLLTILANLRVGIYLLYNNSNTECVVLVQLNSVYVCSG